MYIVELFILVLVVVLHTLDPLSMSALLSTRVRLRRRRLPIYNIPLVPQRIQDSQIFVSVPYIVRLPRSCYIICVSCVHRECLFASVSVCVLYREISFKV